MRDTRLYICTDDVQQTWSEVDLYNDIEIPITYSVKDISNIEDVEGAYSLTVKIPNTSHNADVFGIIHEIERYNCPFEMQKVYKAFVDCGSNRVLSGYFKLQRVIVDEEREISYEGMLYDDVIAFAAKLGDTTLRGNADSADDLDFSQWTSVMTPDRFLMKLISIKEPWGCTLIDKTDKYKWPMYERASGSNTFVRYNAWYFDELTPFLYVKDIVDKIMKWAGFEYVSDFFNGGDNEFRFRDLIYPWHNANKNLLCYDVWSKVRQTVSQDQNIDLSASMPSSGFYYKTPGFPTSYGYSESETGLTSLNPWSFTAHDAGVYHIKFSFPFRVSRIALKSGLPHANSHISLNSSFNASTAAKMTFGILLEPFSGGSWSNTIYQKQFAQDAEDEYTTDSNARFTAIEDEFEWEYDCYMNAGDSVKIMYQLNFYNVDSYGNYQFIDNNSSNIDTHKFDVVFKKKNVGDDVVTVEKVSDWTLNGKFNPTMILNPKTKKIDFIMAIVRKFNLMIENVSGKPKVGGVGVYDVNTLRIEPRTSYYDGTVKDWTEKVDRQSISFSRPSDYLDKMVTWKDSNNDGYWEHTYNSLYTETYGERRLYGPFHTDSKSSSEINTILGETMVGPVSNDTQILQCPKMVSFSDDWELQQKKDWNDRMFFRTMVTLDAGINGAPYSQEVIALLPRSPYNGLWFDEIEPLTDNYFNSLIGDSRKRTTKVYSHSDHLNGVYGSETADLNWWYANWYYQFRMTGFVTDNNCYNRFWREMMDEINDKNARLLTCKMWLKSSDIRDLRMSDFVRVDNLLYRINKINEWTKDDEPTEVELLKVIVCPDETTDSRSSKKAEDNSNNGSNRALPVRFDAKGEISALCEKIDSMCKNINELQDKILSIEKKL